MSNFSIVIHGGAGTILKKDLTPELEKAYKDGLAEAVNAGFEVLSGSGSALLAVSAATIVLENNILFNAGRGSVFTKSGHQEMDAAIMDGSNLAAGAIAGVRNIRNPIQLALSVMNNSPHVMLCGPGANEFAKAQGIKEEPDEYFFSDFRKAQWDQLRGSEHTALDTGNVKEKKFGTVGAVACDQQGNIAAATSTGGMTNKQFGRVGDSPIIGAGTYANNKTCAISCTGHGEPFIRAVTAYDVSCLMEYQGLGLQQAMEKVTLEKLVQIDGEGGMIGVDAAGNTAMVFNSDGMYRGRMTSTGVQEILIYR